MKMLVRELPIIFGFLLIVSFMQMSALGQRVGIEGFFLHREE
jgi:hypothetical protein